jgi:hypothetical protein
MPRKTPSKEDLGQFKNIMADMATARLDIFSANAVKYAETLGAFRASLEKSGFSDAESMQIVLKLLERPGRPIFGGGRGGHWRKG